MDTAWIYNVNVDINFDISEMYKGDINAIGAEEYIEEKITKWIYDSFNIAEYQQDDVVIKFSYSGKMVTASFEFEICDDSLEEAESFVDYCIKTSPLPYGMLYCGHHREATELYSDKH